jgi:hypothetical protein
MTDDDLKPEPMRQIPMWFFVTLINAIVVYLIADRLDIQSRLSALKIAFALWAGFGLTFSSWSVIFARQRQSLWLAEQRRFSFNASCYLFHYRDVEIKKNRPSLGKRRLRFRFLYLFYNNSFCAYAAIGFQLQEINSAVERPDIYQLACGICIPYSFVNTLSRNISDGNFSGSIHHRSFKSETASDGFGLTEKYPIFASLIPTL